MSRRGKKKEGKKGGGEERKNLISNAENLPASSCHTIGRVSKLYRNEILSHGLDLLRQRPNPAWIMEKELLSPYGLIGPLHGSNYEYASPSHVSWFWSILTDLINYAAFDKYTGRWPCTSTKHTSQRTTLFGRRRSPVLFYLGRGRRWRASGGNSIFSFFFFFFGISYLFNS